MMVQNGQPRLDGSEPDERSFLGSQSGAPVAGPLSAVSAAPAPGPTPLLPAGAAAPTPAPLAAAAQPSASNQENEQQIVGNVPTGTVTQTQADFLRKYAPTFKNFTYSNSSTPDAQLSDAQILDKYKGAEFQPGKANLKFDDLNANDVYSKNIGAGPSYAVGREGARVYGGTFAPEVNADWVADNRGHGWLDQNKDLFRNAALAGAALYGGSALLGSGVGAAGGAAGGAATATAAPTGIAGLAASASSAAGGGTLGSLASGAVSGGAWGGLVGGGSAALQGKDILQGAIRGGTTGAITGGMGGALSSAVAGTGSAMGLDPSMAGYLDKGIAQVGSGLARGQNIGQAVTGAAANQISSAVDQAIGSTVSGTGSALGLDPSLSGYLDKGIAQVGSGLARGQSLDQAVTGAAVNAAGQGIKNTIAGTGASLGIDPTAAGYIDRGLTQVGTGLVRGQNLGQAVTGAATSAMGAAATDGLTRMGANVPTAIALARQVTGALTQAIRAPQPSPTSTPRPAASPSSIVSTSMPIRPGLPAAFSSSLSAAMRSSQRPTGASQYI